MTRTVILFTLAFLTACGGSTTNSTSGEHANHHSSSNNSSTPSVDHNAMGHGNATSHSEMQSSPGASSAPFELQFIDTMIAHHQGAIDMAKLAETRAQNPELKKLAADIIYEQESEIAKMSKLRERWFGEKREAVNMQFPGMAHGMGGMDLKKLESLTGREFDREFVRQMIPHHEGAVQMAKALGSNDTYSELKDLASDIISAQEAEIKQMQKWLGRF